MAADNKIHLKKRAIESDDRLPEGSARSKDHTFHDQPGLILRVTENGARIFMLRYTSPLTKKRRKLTLGQWGDDKLKKPSDVSNRATYYRVMIEDGQDPQSVINPGQMTDGAITDARFGQVADKFVEFMKNADPDERLADRTISGREYWLQHDNAKTFRNLLAGEIRATHVTKAMRAWTKDGSTSAANEFRAAVLATFAWLMNEGQEFFAVDLAGNPAASAKRKTEEARKRVLAPEEIALSWAAMDRYKSESARAMLRMILTTGQRPGEIRKMRWGHIQDDGWWKMPKGYTKTGNVHWVYLSDFARELLGYGGEAWATRPRRGLVFPATELDPESKKPLPDPVPCHRTVLSNAARRIQERDDALADYRDSKVEIDDEGGEIELDLWTPHDLRRTMRTQLSDQALTDDTDLAEIIIGHARRGIEKVYNTAKKLPLRIEVMDAWAGFIKETVETVPPANS